MKELDLFSHQGSILCAMQKYIEGIKEYNKSITIAQNDPLPYSYNGAALIFLKKTIIVI